MSPKNLKLDGITTHNSGYDYLTADPGALKSWQCQVCGSETKVIRNASGPTSWAEAMAKKGHLHDSFICPHTDQEWHQLAYRMVKEAQETASPMIANFIHQDLEKLLKENLNR